MYSQALWPGGGGKLQSYCCIGRLPGWERQTLVRISPGSLCAEAGGRCRGLRMCRQAAWASLYAPRPASPCS